MCMNSKYNQLKAGVLLTYLQMGVSVLVGLIYTPVMLNILGQSEYGLYNTVSSTISMLSILSLGFSGAYIRYYARYKAQLNVKAINKLNSLFITIFAIIALIALICGIFLSENLDIVFAEGLTPDELETARTLTQLLSLNIAFTFLFSVFSSIISAHEEFVFQKLINIIRTIASPMITLPVLLLGYGSIGMVVMTVIVSLAADMANVLFCLRKLHVGFDFHDWEHGLLSSLLGYVGFIAINLIVDQINWNIDKVLLGRFCGTTAVAVYSIGYTLYQYYMQFASAVSSVFIPRVHQIENADESELEKNKRHTELMIKVGRIQFLLLGMILCGLILFGRSFIRFWAGEGYENAYYVCLLLTIPTTIPLIQNIGIEIQRAKNKHQFRSIVYAIMAVINLVITVFLCQKWGEIGSALGTAVSLVIANGIIINIYYYHLRIDILKFWKQIGKQMIGIVLALCLGMIMIVVVPPRYLSVMIVEICLFTMIYFLCVWFISMNSYEKNLVLKVVRKVGIRHA